MLRCSKFLTLVLLMSPAIGFAREVPNGDAPAFTPVPELSAGFDLLYWMHNENIMATEKLAEGIRKFNSDAHHLEDYALSQVAEKVG